MKIVGSLVLVVVFVFSLPQSAGAEKMLTILGDSLTEGYGLTKDSAFPALVEKRLPGWKVINAGISGSTSASAPDRVAWALKAKPSALLLALGANDGLRGLSVEEMKKNLAKAIQVAKDAKVKVMLAGMQAPPNYGSAFTSRFAAVFPALAKEKNIPLFPFLLKDVAGATKLNLADGIHPNEAGHRKMAENLLPFLKRELAAQDKL